MERHHQMRRPPPPGRDGGYGGHGGGRDSYHGGGGGGGGGANFSSTACNICGHEGHKAADCPNGTTIWEGRYDFTDYEYFVKEDLDTKTLSESARVYAKAIAEGVDVVTATNRALAIINKIPTPAEASAWVEAYDVQLKKPYFFNKKTLKSQWERPPEMGFGVPPVGGMPPNGMPPPPMGMMPPPPMGMMFPRP